MTWLAIFGVAVCLADAPRPKPPIDPETPHGYLLQRILQEEDHAARIGLLEEFVRDYPKHDALAWALDQLTAAYLRDQQFEKLPAAAQRLLQLEPGNVMAAQAGLQAGEAMKNPAVLATFGPLAWEAAARQLKSAPAEQTQFLQQVQTYAEYAMYTAAMAAADPKRRAAQLAALETLNPKGRYVSYAQAELVRLYRQLGEPARAIGYAEKAVAQDPNNEDMHLTLLDYWAQRGDNPEKLALHAARIVEILTAKTAPEGVTAADWDRKKSQYLTSAYYAGGIASSLLRRFGVADRYLRAALPSIKDPAQLAAAYYHLGFVNYKLAETGERGRVPEALRFNELCAAIKSTYQEQALKNIAAIKSEYNLGR
jgi:tetratricopeptide (TPR) repeat protein